MKPGKSVIRYVSDVIDGLRFAAHFEEFMMKKIGIIFLACLLMMLPGCGKEEEVDLTKQEIIKISITPMPSPTPAPSEIAPEAVVTEGNLTMVNEYLASNIEATVIDEAVNNDTTAGNEE